MSFHVQKWPDISNDWLDIPSIKVAKEKIRGGGGGGKGRRKIGRKEKKKGQQNKRKERRKRGGKTIE